MSFTPSDKFNERWLQSPDAMKQAIHNELDDIILLLQDGTVAKTFEFTTPDLDAKLEHLQIAHLDTLKQLAKKLKAQKANDLIPELEKRLDDKLTGELAELSDELKRWIRQVIQEELEKMDD